MDGPGLAANSLASRSSSSFLRLRLLFSFLSELHSDINALFSFNFARCVRKGKKGTGGGGVHGGWGIVGREACSRRIWRETHSTSERSKRQVHIDGRIHGLKHVRRLSLFLLLWEAEGASLMSVINF